MRKPTFSEPAERLLSEYLCQSEGKTANGFRWKAITSTGSTSDRYLISPIWTGKQRSYVLKHYSLESLEKEFRWRQALREHASLIVLHRYNDELFSTPAPVGVLDDPPCVIMEYAPGVNLGFLMWRDIRFFVVPPDRKRKLFQMIRDIASVLRFMQVRVTDHDAFIPRAGIAYYHNFVDEQCRELRDLGLPRQTTDRWIKRISDGVETGFSNEVLVFQHTDFYEENIIYGEGRYTLLDFPNSVFGSRYWDISHQFVSLEVYKLFRNVDGKNIDELKSTFLDSFDIDTNRFRFFNACHYLFAFRIHLLRRRTSGSSWRRWAMGEIEKFFVERIERSLA